MPRDVVVRLSANTSGYIAGMGGATGATNKLEGSLARVHARGLMTEKAVDRIGKVSGRAFLGGAAAIGLAEKKAADFNAEMATVNTLSHATARQQNQLAKAAMGVGVNIGYSATQSAQAEEELVKAGVSVKNILGGSLKGALDLAAAGQTSVADATEVAAAAMTQFRLKGKDVPHIADLLAAGADKALGNVTDLGYGLSQAGTTAHQFGFSIEQTVGTLAQFAKAGLTGERGGTTLKQMFLKLAHPSKEAGALMDQYGFSIYKANGQMKTMPQIAGNLQKSFANLAPAQRNSALAAIFGSRAIQGANILMAGGEKANRKWIKSVNDQGFAAHQAAGKMNSLKGDLQKLDAQLGNAFINSAGKQGFLRGETQKITNLVKGYNNLSRAERSAIDHAVVYGTAAAGGIYAVTKAVKGVRAIKDTFGATSRAARAAESVVGQRVFVTNFPPGFGTDLPGKPGSTTPIPSGGGTAAERAAARRAAADEAATASSRFRGGPGLAGWSPYLLPLLTSGDSAKGQGAEHMSKQALQAHYSQVAGIKSVSKSLGANSFGFKGSTDADTLLTRMLGKDPARGVAILQKAADLTGKTTKQFLNSGAFPKSAKYFKDTKDEISQQATLQRLLAGTAGARKKSTLTLGQYAAGLQKLPAAVATKITAPGFQATSGNIRKLQHQYGLTKPELRTIIRLLGGPAAISAADRVQARLNALNGKTATTYIHTITSASGVGSKKPAQSLGEALGAKPRKADGGYITGPGGPRDDLVDIAASNGEFVVNAAATAQNRALLEAINGRSGAGNTSGRFADGGPVEARRRRSANDNNGTKHVNKRLKELEASLKRATKAVNNETTARDALTSKRSDLQSAITDKFSSDPFAAPSSVWSGGGGAGSADAIVRGDTAKAKQFLAVLVQLKKAGLTSDALASIAQTGDLGQAKALLAGGAASARKYQSDFNVRAATVGAVAQYAGSSAYGAQQVAATRLLASLEAHVKSLETEIKAHHKGAHKRAEAVGHAAGDAVGHHIKGATAQAGRNRSRHSK